MPVKTALINSFLVIASTVLTLVGIEIGLRLLHWPSWDVERRAGWKSTDPDGFLNELRYRGKPIRYSDRDIVIVLLGDSQVQAAACSPDEMPEQFLENYLDQFDPRYKVFSLGSGGYGNDQEYLALKEYFGKYRANAVVLWETFDNDIWNNVFPTHWPKDGDLKPTFWLDHGALKGPNYQLEELIGKRGRTKLEVLLHRLHYMRDLDESWERYLPRPYQPLTHYDGSFATDWDPSNPNNKWPYLKDENLKNEKSHFSVQLYPRSARMQYGLDLTRKLFGLINDLAREHDSKFFLFYTVTPDDQLRLKNDRVDDIIVHKRDGLFYRTRFRQSMANQAYLNNGFTTLAIPILLRDWRVSATNGHLNCAANEQVMRDLAAKIAKHDQVGQLPRQ
jgi:hypothetical protein